jgi:hypothetical protein
MNNRGYFLVLCILLGLTPAGVLGQEAGAGETVSEETAPLEETQEETLPQSDEVIDQIAGEVEIRPDQVVKRAKLQFGELEIKGTVLEDVQMIAGEIEVEGRVNDRVELVFGEVDISGYVGPGGVDVKFGEVTVSGVVEGPVTVEFGDVRVRGDGVIRGNVSGQFTGRSDSDRSRREVMRERRRQGMSRLGNWLSDVARPFMVFIVLMTLIGLAAIILIIATLFRNTIQKGSTLMQTENLAWNLLWGALAVLLFVPLFVVLCVTIIGIPLALLLLFLYPVAWLFGLILLADHLGDWILTHLIKSQSNFLVGTIFGIIVLGISMAVPIFGGFLMIVYTLLAFGLSFQLMFGYFQNRGQDEAPPPPEAEVVA